MAVSEPAVARAQLASALAALERTAWELNSAASWLSREGHETESDMIEQSARSILAACWLLSRPFRAQPPPERWSAAQQG
jgi:hypothetical protein